MCQKFLIDYSRQRDSDSQSLWGFLGNILKSLRIIELRIKTPKGCLTLEYKTMEIFDTAKR